MLPIETDRLILRPLCAADFDDVHSYASVLENVRYMTFGPNTPEDTRKFLAECEKGWAMSPIRKYDFGIILKENSKLIGAIGMYLSENLREAMLGWVLHRDYWRRGYMFEAACGVMRHGFAQLSLHRIFTTCFAVNIPSYGLMEKLGMRREGVHIKKLLLRNAPPETWCDEYHYAILGDEWRQRHNA